MVCRVADMSGGTNAEAAHNPSYPLESLIPIKTPLTLWFRLWLVPVCLLILLLEQLKLHPPPLLLILLLLNQLL